MISALDSGASAGSGFGLWPLTLCCVLGQDTLLSQCLTQEYKWLAANCFQNPTNCVE